MPDGSSQDDSYPHCVICFKPLGDDMREFPDGCLAHERCFVDTPWEAVRIHMVTTGEQKP